MPVLPSIGTNLGRGWGSLLKRVSVDGERAADVLADQVRFRIASRAGDGTAGATIVPDSARARELWQQPQTRQFMEGVLELADEVGTEPSPLNLVTLATSDAGYVLNRATSSFRRSRTPTRSAFAAAMDAASNHVAGTVAVRKGNALHLGPKRSEGILWALEHPGVPRSEMPPRISTALGRGVKTLLHELDHVGTPKRPETKHLDWLREGRAETFARWPGRVPAAGRTLGLDVPSGVGRWADEDGPYQNEVAAVRVLLRMTGIDTRRAAHFDRARALIGTTEETKLAATIARAVSDRYATTDEEGRALRATVRSLVNSKIAPDGSHANPRPARRLARSLETGRRERLAAERA